MSCGSFLKQVVLLLSVSAVSMVYGQVAPGDESRIKEALEYQLSRYPYSQYRDIYKNFMQDYFGPGHILANTVAAGKYLRKELNETQRFGGPDYEPTGFNGNFYRVNLRLIADGTVPYQTFFDTFVESVQSISPPGAEEWVAIWTEIDKEIIKLNLHFDNEDADREALARQFAGNDFIVHHSKIYDANSDFHYRIISKENFEKILLPLIKH